MCYRAKITNIEATEDAKQKLLWERMNKKEEVSAFVPTNMAVNYMQHNRCQLVVVVVVVVYTPSFSPVFAIVLCQTILL